MKDFDFEDEYIFETWAEEYAYHQHCKNDLMVQSLRETFGLELIQLKQVFTNTFRHRINRGDQYKYTGKTWEKLPPKWNSWYDYDYHVEKAERDPKMVQTLRDTFDLDFINDLRSNGKYYYLVTDGDTFLKYKGEVWTKFPRPVVNDRIDLGIAQVVAYME